MKVTFALLVVIALFAFSADCLSISWNGNVTAAQIKNLDQFHARKSLVIDWGGLIKAASYYSAFVDFERDGNSVDVEADAILGVIGYQFLPASVFAYYDGSANIDVVSGANSQSANIETDESAGYLLSTFLRIEERTPSGSVVETHRFKNFLWKRDSSSSSEGLHYLTIKAATSLTALEQLLGKTAAPFDVYITWLIADTYGIVNVDGVDTLAFPKNLESFIKIEGYDYSSAENKLVLVMGGCSGSASRERKAVLSLAELDVVSTTNELHIVYAGEAVVDGDSKSVEIKRSWDIEATAIIDDSSDATLVAFAADLDSAWGGSTDCHLSEITFEADAATIKYDPGLSQGPLPASAATVLFSLLVIAIAALI